MAYIPDLIDAITNSRTAIDIEHYQLHKSRCFETFDQQTITGSNTFDYLLITPATAGLHCHLVMSVEADAKCFISLYEGTTVSANGTSLSTFNNSRDSASVAGMLVYTAPTVTSIGTQIDLHMTGPGERAGGQLRAGDEWILKNNSKYVVRVTAGGTGCIAVLSLHWYELVDGAI